MAKAARPRTTVLHRPQGWRLVIASLALLAFAFQSYVLQTHIHIAGDSRPAAHGVHHGKAPLGEDPSNCPICQEILHAGQFVAPTAQVFLPPFAAVSTILLVDATSPVVVALSHNWQGRAPPRR